MRQKIAFIAVGQAGGNIAQLFEEKGFSVLYINTSKEDLDTLDKAKYKYHLPGGEGCNKNRKKAKKLVCDDYDNIANELENKLNIDADIIYVVFSSGGGTGSGAGPMLIDLLIDDGRTVGAVTVLPAPDESPKAHINAYECFGELTQIEHMASCFIIDNGRADKLELNRCFVEDFISFVDIPDKHKSIKGNIDRAEIIETLKAHGMAIVVRSAGKSPEVIQSLHDNVFAQSESDHVVKYVTASLSGTVSISDIEKDIGTPLDDFRTYNDEETIVCISGLSYPQTRLDIVYNIAQKNKDVINNNLAAVKELKMKQDVNFLADEEPKEPERKPKSRRDIMNKYL